MRSVYQRTGITVLRAPDREFLVRLAAVSRIEPLTDDARFGPLEFSDDA